jgi:hypothetical protein
MTHETVRLVQNLDRTLRSFNAEQFFVLAQSLASELDRRGSEASLEARALMCALLPAARELHQLRRAAEESSE